MEKAVLIVALALSLLLVAKVQAGDPDIITDFVLPEGVEEAKVDGSYFTFTGFRGGAESKAGSVGLKKASITEFPALGGMGLSMELLQFPAGAVNVPHTHPRGGELLFVMDGALTVGVVDSTGKLFKNVLQKGDVFVFPKGLPHYQANMDKSNKAVALSSFGSVNAGTVDLPKDLFASQIPDEVLTKSFKLSANSLNELKQAFSSQN
eukprot:Gb_05122 [translate_table: standard]